MIIRILKWFFITAGFLAMVLIILAFTSAPFWIYYNMGTKYSGIHRPPDYIVVMGGGGMPSETGLMRCFYAAKAASYFTRAKVIITLPGDTIDSLSSINLMKKELTIRGIAKERIIFESEGTNTRAEAVNVWEMLAHYPSPLSPPQLGRGQGWGILIVTSPEHLARSVLAFRKAGFIKVDGVPAFESTLNSDLSYSDRKLGGRKWMLPGLGQNITLRYRFWTHLSYEERFIREYIALAYYKLKGWI